MNKRYMIYIIALLGLVAFVSNSHRIIAPASAGVFDLSDNKKETTFIYVGDIQGEFESWAEMMSTALEENAPVDFVQTGGDMVNSGKQWKSLMKRLDVFGSVPFMPAAGNHEGKASHEKYKQLFELPQNGPDIETLKESFYYYDSGVCRVIVMDSSFLTEERRRHLGDAWQRCESNVEAWLKDTLKSSDAIWNIVVTHHPPYGLHDFDTTSPQIRKLWTPIMEEEGVDLVLSGHQHMYMRTNKIKGITYVMGNGGYRESEYYYGFNAPLYAEVTDITSPNYQVIEADINSLKVTSKNKTGLVIDKAIIRKSLRFHIFELFSGNEVVIESAQVNEIE